MIDTVEQDWRFGTLELPAQDRYILPAIALTGEYGGDEIDLYQALLKPDDVAIDVGANIGVFSIAMATAVGVSGRVLSIEPQPPLFVILERNIARHGLTNVEPHRAIASNHNGTGAFLEIKKLPPEAKVNFGALNLDSRILAEYGHMAPTPTLTIDSFNLDRCDFIKIDVEGSEVSVISGATETIQDHRPILCLECDLPNAASPWVDPFFRANYRLWRFRGKNMRTPNPKSAITGLSDIAIIMVLAIPVEKTGRLEGVDLSRLYGIGSREELEQLSRSMHKVDEV